MSKGMSLALETIIILILSLTVFTALTYFFNLQFGRGQTTVDLLNGQREWCGAYLRQDNKCIQTGYDSVKSSKEGQETLKRLTFYCGRIQGYPNCQPLCSTVGDSSQCKIVAEKDCVFDCCTLYCPAGTRPKAPAAK
ncbi:MAG: hypothetical protein J4469_01695 [Candidatus Aenigmarchaeota archaeon]|nr:hypothetical protein [Candidatus Aenigmarchaeota archaeon]